MLWLWWSSRQGPALQQLALCKTMAFNAPLWSFPISITWRLIETQGLSPQTDLLNLKPWGQEPSNPHFNRASMWLWEIYWKRHQAMITYSRKHQRFWRNSTEVVDRQHKGGTVHIARAGEVLWHVAQEEGLCSHLETLMSSDTVMYFKSRSSNFGKDGRVAAEL